MSNYRIRTGSGTVHNMTDGKTFTHRGESRTNDSGSVMGKSDCGSLTSSAASFTEEPLTCAKCIALNPAPACECAAGYLNLATHTPGCPLDNSPAAPELAPELAPAGPSHNPAACSVKGCQLGATA